jgi:hypothetical protein
MKCFQIATTIAVLVSASASRADNLPPVPKTVSATVSAVIKEKTDPAPTPKVEQPSCCAAEAPLPPVSGKVETTCDRDPRKCRRPIGEVAVFLVNELLRKPIYDVQNAINELEGRRLCREDHRLGEEAEWLACRAAELADKANHTCPCDLHAKLQLLIEQRNYATRANNLAVKKAALECRQVGHQQRTEKLDAKRAELFGCD